MDPVRTQLPVQTQTHVDLYHLPEVDSTNLFLRREVEAGHTSSAAAYCDQQTSGRGRLGREWKSPKGGLYLSFASPIGMGSPLDFGMAACIEIAEVLAESYPDVFIKWPNDLVAITGDQHNTENKLGGFLSSFVQLPKRENHVVVGVGINLNTIIDLGSAALPTSLPPVSFKELVGAETDIETLVKAVVPRVFSTFQELRLNPESTHIGLIQRWRMRSATLGRKVKVTRMSGEIVEGTAVDIGSNFHLQLKLESGEELHLREV